MVQIFTLGSSSVYGVGSGVGGWGDMVKQDLHERMYGKDGVGEKYEVFNFAKSGATAKFVIETFPSQLEQYGRGGKIISIVYVGGNNAKAEGTSDNFVSTIEEFNEEMTDLLELLKKKSSHFIAVGSGYYDESKVNPKSNPLTGGKSYFKNARKREFETRFKKLAEERNMPFIEVGVDEEEWKEKYLYMDGLHPNQAGYRLIADKILTELDKLL
jgi:lysophospholipase L1-like esterase